MARVVVTGGAGLVGRFITEHFVASGHDVTVTGRTPPHVGFFSRAVDFASMPLDPDHDYRPLFEGAEIVVHGAFAHIPGRYRGGEGDDPEGFRRQNLDGSLKLFQDAKAMGVPHLAFLSSRAVYGTNPPGTTLTETMPLAPDTLYGEVKYAGECALTEMADDRFTPFSLRITGVYGPAGPGKPHKWADLFADYVAGRHVPVRAATEVHGHDVALAIETLHQSARNRVRGNVYNVSDVIVDTRDILAPLAQRLPSPPDLPAHGDADAVCAMSTERLSGLGWTPGGRALFDQTVHRLATDYTAL